MEDHDLDRTKEITDPTYLRVGEVTRLLNIHANTLRRWSDLKLIEHTRLGSRGDRLYRLSDISAFIGANNNY